MSLTGKVAANVLRGKISNLDVIRINAYEIAVQNGYKGTVAEWLASMKGEDGFSPVIEVTEITGGHMITITDANGTNAFEVMDGTGGAGGGESGKDGRGIVSVRRTSGNGAAGTTDTYTITYTDNTTSTFTVYNGKNGTNGISATHSWNGTTLTITSASGTSSANLKGAKGDKGDKGDTGAPGSDGKDGTDYVLTSADKAAIAEMAAALVPTGGGGSTGGSGDCSLLVVTLTDVEGENYKLASHSKAQIEQWISNGGSVVLESQGMIFQPYEMPLGGDIDPCFIFARWYESYVELLLYAIAEGKVTTFTKYTIDFQKETMVVTYDNNTHKTSHTSQEIYDHVQAGGHVVWNYSGELIPLTNYAAGFAWFTRISGEECYYNQLVISSDGYGEIFEGSFATANQTEIVNSVLAALPTWTGGSY